MPSRGDGRVAGVKGSKYRFPPDRRYGGFFLPFSRAHYKQPAFLQFPYVCARFLYTIFTRYPIIIDVNCGRTGGGTIRQGRGGMFSPVWLPLKGGGKDMDMIIGAVVTLGLLIYLTYSLIKAEDL